MERQREVGLLKDSSEDRLMAVTTQNGMPNRYSNIYLAVAGCACHLR